MLGCSVFTLTFSAPRDNMLAMLFCTTLWLSMHRYTLAYMSMQVLLTNVSSMLQHNEAMDIRSKPTFVPCGHCPCLFAILLCFPFCSHPNFYVCHVYHVYLLYASLLCSLHLFLPQLICWFLVFAFAYTHMERGRMELRHGLLGTSKMGEDVSTRIRAKWLQSVGLGVQVFPSVMYSFKPLPFSSLSPLDGLYQVYLPCTICPHL